MLSLFVFQPNQLSPLTYMQERRLRIHRRPLPQRCRGWSMGGYGWPATTVFFHCVYTYIYTCHPPRPSGPTIGGALKPCGTAKPPVPRCSDRWRGPSSVDSRFFLGRSFLNRDLGNSQIEAPSGNSTKGFKKCSPTSSSRFKKWKQQTKGLSEYVRIIKLSPIYLVESI